MNTANMRPMATRNVVTDTNKAPLVEVLALMFLVIVVLSCFVRVGTKLHMVKTLKADDYLTIVATAFAIAQSITVCIECINGLGKPFKTLTTAQKDSFYKAQYAANSMFIIAIALAKMAAALGLRMLSRKDQKPVILSCEILCGLWGFTALIVNLFQCRLPTPWAYGGSDSHCINRAAFWTYYSVGNIITDLIIVGIMINSARQIHTSASKKALVICVFGSRILVTPLAIVQIYYTNKPAAFGDASYNMWEAAISMQLVQCLAILTVCVPSLKPFLESLESGQIRVDDLRRQGKTNSNGYPSSYNYNNRGYSGFRSAQRSGGSSRVTKSNNLDSTTQSSKPRSRRDESDEVHELVDMGRVSARVAPQGAKKGSWDGQSNASDSSQAILVQQTWQVDVQQAREQDVQCGGAL